MHSALREVLDRIYVQKDFAWYDEITARPFRLATPLVELIERHGLELLPTEIEIADHWPSVRYYLSSETFSEGSFSIHYRFELQISKLYPAYALQFFYSVPNRDPEASFPSLDGGGEEPLTLTLHRFQDEFVNEAIGLGWLRLTPDERDETWPPAEASLWTALSYDLLERCPD